jgi:hypothetical protein
MEPVRFVYRAAKLRDGSAEPPALFRMMVGNVPSPHCLIFGWKSEAKVRTARRIVGGPQPPPMLFNDGAAYRQTDTDTMRFGGEERVENLIDRHRWQSSARIAN